MEFITILFGLTIWAATWFVVYLYIMIAKYLNIYVKRIPVISLKNFIYISFGFFTWFLISTFYWGYPIGIIINLILLYLIIWGGLGSFLFELVNNSFEKSKNSKKFIGYLFIFLSKIPILGNPIFLLLLLIFAYFGLGIELMLFLIEYFKTVLN